MDVVIKITDNMDMQYEHVLYRLTTGLPMMIQHILAVKQTLQMNMCKCMQILLPLGGLHKLHVHLAEPGCMPVHYI